MDVLTKGGNITLGIINKREDSAKNIEALEQYIEKNSLQRIKLKILISYKTFRLKFCKFRRCNMIKNSEKSTTIKELKIGIIM